MMRSLYWKIIATFLVVVAAATVVGSTVFSLASHALLAPLRRDATLALARAGAGEVERYFARGGKPEGLDAHLTAAFRDLPTLTILYAGPDGRIAGKEEPNRPELRAALADVVRRGLPDGPRVEFLGAGHGALAILPVGPPERPGYALLAGRAHLMEDVAPAVLTAAVLSLGAVFVVAALLGLIVFRFVTRRLGLVRDALAGVARGDLALRIRDPGSDEIADVGASFDRMADRLEQSVAELGANDERRRRFLADVSHELKSPLTALRGHLERLLPGAPQGPLHIAYEEVDRLFLLIEDLLEMARMDATDFRLKKDEEVLQRIGTRVAERFRVALDNRGIALTTRFSPEPVRRAVDARRIEQVLANLVQNALHSMPDGGALTLAIDERAGRAVLAVTDTGPGVPAAERERVFERFYSGTGGTGGGTGLGLSIVKRLVDAHGGTVRLEPGDGGTGTRAVVEL